METASRTRILRAAASSFLVGLSNLIGFAGLPAPAAPVCALEPWPGWGAAE